MGQGIAGGGVGVLQVEQAEHHINTQPCSVLLSQKWMSFHMTKCYPVLPSLASTQFYI